jgi:hypothetical protein
MTKPRRLYSAIGARLVIVCCALLAWASLNSPKGLSRSRQESAIPPAVEEYSRLLARVQGGERTRPGIEALLQSGRAAARALTGHSPPGGRSALEQLNSADFRALALKMEGFIVRRNEVERVEPDPLFFLALSRRAGDQTDVQFFESCTALVSEGLPVYLMWQTDYSACTRFGTMGLVDAYGKWSRFQAAHPGRYREETGSFLRDIEEELTGGTCACGNREAVLKELDAFVRLFPGSEIVPKVRRRADQIRRGSGGMRFRCVSG